jgi:hypothetical protein
MLMIGGFSYSRDVFEEKPLETAQDLLPGVVSLLQTVADLSVTSIALIIRSITACVKADLLEARSSKLNHNVIENTETVVVTSENL